jgi:hypothetical protein
MSRWSNRLILGAVALLGATVGLAITATAAHAAGARGAAFVWSYDAFLPLGEDYTPTGSYQFNSSSPDNPNNVVRHVETGMYLVGIPGLTGFGATHATAYGGDAAYCNAGDAPFPDSSQAVVMCYNAHGARVDHMFTLSFTSATPSIYEHPLAYMEVESDGSIFDSMHFNSGGDKSWVTRSGATYQVHIPNLGAFNGHVQVTAADDGNRCLVQNWFPSGDDQLVNVRCLLRGGFGAASNATFILTFTADQNILAQQGHDSAYAWANQPSSTDSYQPSTPWLFTTGPSGTATAARTSAGNYSMTFDGVDLNSGNIQVSTYGWGTDFCNVVNWFDSTVQIRCFDWNFDLVDSYYTVAFTGTFPIGG